MTDFDIVTLTHYGDFDFKTITISLFSKFDRQPFFLAIEIKRYVPSLVCQETDNLLEEIPFYSLFHDMQIRGKTGVFKKR